MSIWSHNTCFQRTGNGTKIGLLKTSQLFGTTKLQKTGKCQKNKDRQRSVLSRMWKQHESSTVGSMKQLSLFRSVVFPSGDILVDSGQLSRIFLSLSYVTSKYHHTRIFIEYSDLQKVYSYKKRRKNQKTLIKNKRRKRAPQTFNNGSDLYLATTHLLSKILTFSWSHNTSIWHHANSKHYETIPTQHTKSKCRVHQEVHNTASRNRKKRPTF